MTDRYQDLLDKSFRVLCESSGLANNTIESFYPLESFWESVRELGKAWVKANESSRRGKR